MTNNPIDSHPFVIRYNSDGTLDKNFGNGGSLISEDISGYCVSVALAPDGKIVTGGNYFTGSYLFMVLRYTKDACLILLLIKMEWQPHT